MYLKFYDLSKEPFHITPDPEFLYLSPSHKEAMAAIIYGIEQRKGFVAIIGAVGVGKTTILRSYLDAADRQHLKIIYIFNARLTFNGLLKSIFQELEIKPKSRDAVEMVNSLYEVLIEEYKSGNTLVLVIDEAQNMPVETLENLRMLSNLETTKDKLIQIVLIGQPEFEETLNLDQLRQLKQRIAVRSTIMPLTNEESLEYIKYRIMRAGGLASSCFTKQALNEIVKKARGIPRVINILCDNSLINGFGYQQKPVGLKVVREVIADLKGRRKRRGLKIGLAFGVPSVSLAAIVLVGAYFFDRLPPISSYWKEMFKSETVSSAPEETTTAPEKAPPEKSRNSKPEHAHPVGGVQAGTEQQTSGTPSQSSSRIEQASSQNLATTEREVSATKNRKPTKQRGVATITGQATVSQRAIRGGSGSSALSGGEEGGSSDADVKKLLDTKDSEGVNPNLLATGSKINLPGSSAD